MFNPEKKAEIIAAMRPTVRSSIAQLLGFLEANISLPKIKIAKLDLKSEDEEIQAIEAKINEIVAALKQ